MKKVTFMKLVKEKINSKAFNDLIKRKENHSKVKMIHHRNMKMQKYLMPTKVKISQQDIELIFKLRCRVTNVKANMKSSYESFECDACGTEEETQEHILKCNTLNNNMKLKSENETPEYEEIFHENVKDQTKIAKVFQQKMKLMEKYKDK